MYQIKQCSIVGSKKKCSVANLENRSSLPFKNSEPYAGRMKGLSESLVSAAERFAATEKHREIAIRSSREITRSSKRIIHSIHDGESDINEMKNISELVRNLVLEIKEEPSLLYTGPASDALGEYAEAMILNKILVDGSVPSYEDLGIDERSWALGLADIVGELRRIVLKNLMNGNVEKAVDVYELMEDVTDGILMFDVPDAIVPMRRKQDIARGVMERTRSDIATAVVMSKK